MFTEFCSILLLYKTDLCPLPPGQLLFYNEPFIYSSNMPRALEQKFAMLDRVIRGEQQPQGPQWFRIVNLISQRGKRFMAFAKYRKYNDGMNCFFCMVQCSK